MNIVNVCNPYAWVMRLRRLAYRNGWLAQERAEMPVISIGNLTMGGTGKTPLTILVAKFIDEHLQKRVGIVLRGYGRTTAGQIVVQDAWNKHSTADAVGDEAIALADALPNAVIVVDEVRIRGAKKAKELGAEVLLLDDGFQHLKLHRDLNILLIDVEEGVGTVLPFGSGREVGSATRDADIVIFTNVEDGARAHKISKKIERFIQPNALVAALHAIPFEIEMLRTSVRVGCDLLNGKHVLAVSSIAKPSRFHRLVAECGAIVMTHVLPDHAEYSEHTVKRIMEQAERTRVDMIVTTTKDIPKAREYYLRSTSKVPVVILHQSLEWIEHEEGFYTRIVDCLRETI